MNATILGLGIALSSKVRTNDEWPSSFVDGFHRFRAEHKATDFSSIDEQASARAYDHLYRKYALPFESDPFKGARLRRVVPKEENVIDYEIRAARRALEHSGIDPKEIGMVLSHTLVPDVLGDSNASAVQYGVGAINAAPTMVESYCSSALSQLDLARAMVESGSVKYVLCTQSHIVGDRVNPFDLPTSPIFGDAATAFIVGPAAEGRGITHVVRGGDGSLHNAINFVYRDSPDTAWYASPSGPVVPAPRDRAAAKKLGNGVLGMAIDTVNELRERAKLPSDAIAALVVTQPGPWYPPAVGEGVGVAPERVAQTFETLAHVGGCCTVANLFEADRRGLLRDGAPVVLYANGAGLTRVAALLRWTALPPLPPIE